MIDSDIHKPSPEDEPVIELVYPFPSEEISLTWEWAKECPAKDFDDSTPKTREEFIADIQRRL